MLTLLFYHLNQNELKHTYMLKTIFSINPLIRKSDWLPIFPHSIPLEQNVEVIACLIFLFSLILGDVTLFI